MSTLKTTNIAHPSSASNNIVLDSSARVLVGTSTAYDASTVLQVKGASGFNSGSLDLQSSWRSTIADQGIGIIRFIDGEGGHRATIQCLSDASSSSASDVPGRLVFSTTADGASSPTERMRITNAGEVYIGTTSQAGSQGLSILPNYSQGAATLVFNRASTTNTSIPIYFQNGGSNVGWISYTNASVAYNTTSDYRLKENVEPVTDGITRLQQLKPSRFNFIADPDKTVDGFIAHEVQAVVPEAITGEKDAVDDDGNPVYQGIDQSKLVPLLTAALQEAIGEIESLKARVAALEAA